MSVIGTISNPHIRKLDHSIDEIRLRTLHNIISKFELGFECDCNVVKRELLLKLFQWFTIEPRLEEEKVLNLMIKLLKSSEGSYLNALGRIRVQNELRDLRTRLDSKWHDKLNLMEEIASNPEKFITNLRETPTITHEGLQNISYKNHHYQSDTIESNNFSTMSPLDSSVPIDLTANCEDGAVISKRSESSIKWLAMPWQVLATSDIGILSQIERSLSTPINVEDLITTCQLITNTLLQDFPAEIFLQRPTTVNILLNLLQSYKDETNEKSQHLVITILKTLYKFTRSLRLRIYYYCDPNIAHKAQKILARNLESTDLDLQERVSPEGELHDQNYSYQRRRSRSPNLINTADDAVLQLHQMFIPCFCIENLNTSLKLLSTPIDSVRQLKLVKYIANLVSELIQLFITSVTPTIWFCNDNIALQIHENIKVLFELLSEILDYFSQFNNIDYYRVTYLYFLWISVKLISNIVPLELADQVMPNKMKLSMCAAIMDAPIYLMNSSLHTTLQEYARRFRGKQECEFVKLLDETRLITKSMKSAISLMKGLREHSYSDDLKQIYLAKLSLLYHKNFKLITTFISLAQNKPGYKLSAEDKEITTKMTLLLLAHNDDEVQEATYTECHSLVLAVFSADYCGRYNWNNLIFLMEPTVLTEIICHGTTSENKKIKSMAEDILIFFLKGRTELTEAGWLKFLEALIPVLPLLQCLAHPTTPLGKAITTMLDPDVSSTIKLPFIEILKGNIRLLFSSTPDVRDEALCRLLWLLAQEKDSSQKLPRLTSLHGLSLGSICVFDKQTSARRVEGTYQRNALVSVLEMLQSTNIEPKVRKSALVQVSVMLTNSALHKVFVSENGLSLILDIFSKALIEKDFINYPDSVISIITILKLLVSSEAAVRLELSNQIDVYYNILRSLFLYPNNESVKTDGAQLLALLTYNSYIMRLTERSLNNPFNISLPYLITVNMSLPFTCKAHWKTSIHKRSDVSILHRSNAIASTFVRQFWAWEWNGGDKVLWKKWQDINDPMMSETLMIRENELASLTYTSLHFCIQQQLFNIQNSTTHSEVLCAIDFLTLYLKLCSLSNCENYENIVTLPWANTFEHYLHSPPMNKDDHELFINLLNFLHFYTKLTNSEEATWLCKIVRTMIKSLKDWFQSNEEGSDEVHQSVLRLARACAMMDVECSKSKNSWITFVEFAVSNLFIGDFYNLAFLNCILSTLTYVIGKCEWKNNKEALTSTGNAFIQLILSFICKGTASFMGLTIIRDCIICLNHVLHYMQNYLNKNMLIHFWYGKPQSLNWLPMLWKSRDPLVRASALQLLANLINGPHTALELLNAIDTSPGELCHSLLYFITAQEESCIVKEEACLAMCNLIKNSNSIVFQYVDSLKPTSMLSYVKENNLYHEIAVMCSNCYILSSLDPDMPEFSELDSTQGQSVASCHTTSTISIVPKTIYYLYNCAEDFQQYSDFTEDDNQMQFITTPSLITSLCLLLNNLIAIGELEVIQEIFEHSLYKYMIGCFGDIPKSISEEKNIEHYINVLEMYTSLCTVFTNCIIHNAGFASIVIFPAEFIRSLFLLLNEDLYFTQNSRLITLRNRLMTENLRFLVSLSVTENQHCESIQAALEGCDIEAFMKTICNIIKNSKTDVGISALNFLAFLLSLEMQNDLDENKLAPLKLVLDTKISIEPTELSDSNTNINKLSENHAGTVGNPIDANKKDVASEELYYGADICQSLINLFIAHNYTKKFKHGNDKEVVITALTNLLCVSMQAKKLAIIKKFPDTCMTVLKDTYFKLNSTSILTYKSQIERGQKMHPLLYEIDSIYILLMNFMYDYTDAKEIFAKIGLADIIHKLWAYTSLSKKVLINTLKLISTFTSNCLEAAQSLSLTTVNPGVGLRKTPNSVSLVHVIIQMVIKEIETINRSRDCRKLSLGFQILRNAIHNHESRVVISKSNLLQFFSKIYPSTTKRTKVTQIVEINCLEFLIDFTFYDEGQLSVSKAVDSLEVLINLAHLSTGSARLLAISILRNLAFNITNRPRLLGSTEFLNLLLTSLKNGSTTDIEVASSTLWALISNNQKGKLIARNAGFQERIKGAISRLSILPPVDDGIQEKDVIEILEYLLQILRPQ